MGRLPLRWLVPLAMLGVAFVGGAAVVLVTLLLLDQTVRGNAQEETRRLARTLARALVEPVVRGDVWQAYQLVRAAGESFPDEPREVVVLGDDERVLAASQPMRFPLGQHLGAFPDDLVQAVRAARYAQRDVMLAPWLREAGGETVLVMAEPIVGDDGLHLGTVLAVHPTGLTERQRRALVQRLGLLGLVTLALVGIGGAVLGWRLARPIGALRDSMARVGGQETWSRALDDRALQPLLSRRDEVGELARTYRTMLRQLDSQRVLERQVLEAERLARVGQMAASIAHEVNNPIGGMLAALDNRRLRGGLDEASAHTLDLIERGLRHIHGTVQALLNESRAEQHPLQPQDLDDLRTLLQPVLERSRVELIWALQHPPVPLPALTVRQVLLNLCLNAAAAAGPGGRVAVQGETSADGWRVRVANTGRELDGETFDELVSGRRWDEGRRVGLGLWVCARLLADTRGSLRWMGRQGQWATVLEAAFEAGAGAADREERDAGRLDRG
ncbi:Sporulation kinase D [Tepidimonas sediminis]|uniref:histidine kinase n=1 Tax=Tepidimonas sediminis TaxID=2588941 RepID=A0A554WV04_9BURK|nr:ATP-binding protein [Tepidimonas sediminis]TSE27401.1 Sporulation kinase D [Tepidimonas sediminis]